MNIDCRFYIVISYYANVVVYLLNLTSLSYPIFLRIDYEKKRAMD